MENFSLGYEALQVFDNLATRFDASALLILRCGLFLKKFSYFCNLQAIQTGGEQ